MEKGTLKFDLIESGDGSHTLRVEALKEHYHSHKGAMQESMHVFIKMGLGQLPARQEIAILEVGFGTGLNALLTCLKGTASVQYTALETNPLPRELVSRLNYPQLTGDDRASDLFLALHDAPWNASVEITAGFNLEKLTAPIETFTSHKQFDLVYYDAFAPHAQPELWTPAIWKRLIGLMNPGGVLVTYCAKGQVRRDMQSAGFQVERLEGPPGKREMLRAQKPLA
jgi:tRNA U34 5-methylaminomethyl-2-thiouridine-forming methyltransferase MnmC